MAGETTIFPARPQFVDRVTLTNRLKHEAARQGFVLAGAGPAVEPPGAIRLRQWLAAGYAGEMDYIAERAEAYAHPRHVLEGARSVLMLAAPYCGADPAPARLGHGRVARYAWGDDYHDVIRPRLHYLCDWLREQVPGAFARGVVDTAPLLEREFAQLAGLGWIGKNTLLLNREAGSYFFLAALLTDVELQFDAPFTADYCGSCTACLDACPTQAFVAPYVLDARRCISYLTIELRSEIPTDLRAGVGDWLFGCDVCQEVCPWNHHASLSRTATVRKRLRECDRDGEAADSPPPSTATLSCRDPQHGGDQIELAALFDLDDAAFRDRFRHTPLWRAKRRGVLRNAALVLGNQRCLAALPALHKGARDNEPLVREACAWALAQLANSPLPASSDP